MKHNLYAILDTNEKKICLEEWLWLPKKYKRTSGFEIIYWSCKFKKKLGITSE